DLAVGPRPDVVGAGEGDLDRLEVIDPVEHAFSSHAFLRGGAARSVWGAAASPRSLVPLNSSTVLLESFRSHCAPRKPLGCAGRGPGPGATRPRRRAAPRQPS